MPPAHAPRYLLPCSCGRTVPVERAQAGDRVHCECGKVLDVPTLRGIADLEQERAEVGPPSDCEAWGPHQGVILLGIVVTLIGLALAAFYLYQFSQKPRRAEVTDYRPAYAMQLWSFLKLGIDQPTFVAEAQFDRMHYEFRQSMVVAVAVTAVGLLIMGSSLAFRRPSRRRPPQPKPPGPGGPPGSAIR